MFGRNKKKKKKNSNGPMRVETVIGQGTNITGDLYCKGSLRVEGRIEGGEVVAAGDIYIGTDGEITAAVKGRNIVIAGSVHGDVDSKDKLEIVPSGTLIGDIKMSTLVIEDGATFKGKSESRKSSNASSPMSKVAASKEDNKKEDKKNDKKKK